MSANSLMLFWAFLLSNLFKNTTFFLGLYNLWIQKSSVGYVLFSACRSLNSTSSWGSCCLFFIIFLKLVFCITSHITSSLWVTRCWQEFPQCGVTQELCTLQQRWQLEGNPPHTHTLSCFCLFRGRSLTLRWILLTLYLNLTVMHL